MTASKLSWVSVTHPDQIKDRTVQRSIHSHVMKDIGLSRRRRPRRVQVVLNIPSDLDVDRASSLQHLQRGSRTAPLHLLSSWLPSPMNDRIFTHDVFARYQKLIVYLNTQDVLVCQTLQNLCAALAMRDDSVMSLALAFSALYTEPLNHKPRLRENTSALEHYTASLRLVRQRLNQASNASYNETITAMVGMAAYDLDVRQYDRWNVHMAGLKKIIQGRGGLEKIDSHPIRLVLTWTELVGGLTLDSPPQFPVLATAEGGRQMTASALPPAMARTLSILESRSPDLSDICRVLLSLSGLTQFLSGRGLDHWAEDASLGEALSAVVFAALTVPRLGIPHGQNDASAASLAMREIIRVASLLLLAAPVNWFASNGDIIRNLRGKLPPLYRSYVLDWTGMEELELWILVVGALAEVGEEREWTVSQVHRIMQVRGLQWSNVLYEIGQIAWFDVVMAAELDKLGAEVLRRC